MNAVVEINGIVEVCSIGIELCLLLSALQFTHQLYELRRLGSSQKFPIGANKRTKPGVAAKVWTQSCSDSVILVEKMLAVTVKGVNRGKVTQIKLKTRFQISYEGYGDPLVR